MTNSKKVKISRESAVSVELEEQLLSEIDKIRGAISRSEWIQGALRLHLDEERLRREMIDGLP